ncbi:MAG: tetratricopeptide repeat protein [Bacteroidales bacterium]|nr:tetratricopeptide repeat protein [Bacteroidales bacterium]
MKIKIFAVSLLISLGTVAQTNNAIDSLEKVVESAKGNDKISSMFELSMQYLNESPERAFRTAYKAYYYAAFTADPTMISEAYFTIGLLHHKTSAFDSAMVYLNKALKTCETNERSADILDNMGIVYRDLSRYDSAIIYHNQALKMQQTMGNRDAVASCYKNIGNVYMQMAKYEDALNFYNLSMDEYSLIDDQKSIAVLCNNIASVYVGLNKYSDALSFLTKAVNIQDKIGDRAGEAFTLNGIGNFYFRLKVYDMAQEYYTQALHLRLKLKDNNDIAASQFNIATVHRDLGNYREALKYYNQALELREATNNREAQALIYNAIGGTYKNQKSFSKAIETYQKALDINLAIGSQKSVASSYERLGMVYRDTCLIYRSDEVNERTALENKATLFYKKACEVYKEIGDSLNAARVLNYHGNMFHDLGKIQSAKIYYEQARKLYGNNKLGVAYVAYNEGKLMHEISNADAEKYYLEALALAEQCEEKNLICDVAYSMFEMKKQARQSEQALAYYEKYVLLKEEIDSDRTKNRIAEMEFESDIKVLEQINENQQLKIRENEMKQSQFRILMILLVIVLLVILAFLFFMYRQYVQKKNAYSMLSQKQSELESAYDAVKVANESLEKKKNQIIDSMTYAKRIQKAVLPSEEELKTVFPQNFVYYLSKEIVSGDFYWFSEVNDFVFFAVADCTGHGVPGACMSMVGNTLLNQIVNEMNVTDPAEILNILDKEVIRNLHQNEGDDSQEDGMAISLIRYDKKQSEIMFSGAGQKILVVADGKAQAVSTSMFSIGGMHALKQDKKVVFEDTVIPVKEGTMMYLYTDGYMDQFGGEKNERFSSSRFEEMILEMQALDMPEQYINVSRRFDAWKGSEKQVDDILIVGLKF